MDRKDIIYVFTFLAWVEQEHLSFAVLEAGQHTRSTALTAAFVIKRT